MIRFFSIALVMVVAFPVFSVWAQGYNSQMQEALKTPQIQEALIKTLVQGNGMLYFVNYTSDTEDVKLIVWARYGSDLVEVANEHVSFIATHESYKAQDIRWKKSLRNGFPQIVLCASFKSGENRINLLRFFEKQEKGWEWRQFRRSVFAKGKTNLCSSQNKSMIGDKYLR